MRELYFGGSFNPIHNGHLATASAVAAAGGFDGVVLVPAFVSPPKTSFSDSTSPADRLAMCEIAAKSAAALGRFRVDDIEFHLPKPSYTLETVRALKARGVRSVSWLIGADQVASFPRWHAAQALLREATIVVMARPGYALDFDALPAPFYRLRDNVIVVAQVDVSSTEIRRRARLGLSIAEFVPEGVAEYIYSHRLYGSGGSAAE